MGIEEGLFAVGELIFGGLGEGAAAGVGAAEAAGAGAAAAEGAGAAAADIGAGAAAADLGAGAGAADLAAGAGAGAGAEVPQTLGGAAAAGTNAAASAVGSVSPIGDLGGIGADVAASPVGGGSSAYGMLGDTSTDLLGDSSMSRLGGPVDPATPTSPGIGDFTTTVTPATDVPSGSPPGLFTDQSALPPGFDASAAAGGASPIQQAGAVGATPDPSAAAASGGLFNGTGFMGSGVSGTDLLKYGIPAAGLGYQLLRGEQSLPGQAREASQIAHQEGQMATEFMRLGTAGQITPAQQAQIDIFTQNAKNQLRQQYANAGRNPDTDSGYLYGVQQIDQQAAAMRQQYIDALIREGLQAAGGATATLNQVAQMQIQEDRNFQQAIGDAMKAFGYVMGAGNRPATIQLGR